MQTAFIRQQANPASRAALCNALHDAGFSHRDILRHVRIDWAAQRLAETGQPLTEVALRAGYSDQP